MERPVERPGNRSGSRSRPRRAAESTPRSTSGGSKGKAAARPAKPAAPVRQAARSAVNARLRSDLLAIGFCLVAVLLALAIYRPGSVGFFGRFLVSVVRLCAGHGVHAAPFFFFGAGVMLALDYRRATNAQMLIGAAGIVLAVFGGLQLLTTHHGHVYDTTLARLAALLHRPHDPALIDVPDGGVIGAAVMSVMFPLGRLGSFFTLGAVCLASLLLITELTLRGIADRIHERALIAAEAARQRAEALSEKAQEVASNLPVRRDRAQKLFMELDAESESGKTKTRRQRDDADEEPPSGRRLTRVGRFFRGMKDDLIPEGAGSAETEPAAPPVPVTEAILPLDPEAATDEPRKKPAVTRGKFRPPRANGKAADGDFVMPPLDLLDSPAARPRKIAAETEANIAILENTLAQFRIQAQVVEIADGPSVTRYEIRLGEGIRVKKILDLADNIAMSLAAMSVRVEAPIPGKAAIGIEVPKKQACVVTLRECLEAEAFQGMGSKIGFVLGKDVAGNVRCADMARMPHLLVAGATNSGKSVCLNVLIASLLYRARPDELKMIMIDPKRVELTLFDGIPHLIHPVVKDVKQAAGILRWVLKEMDRRYDAFAHAMTRNLEGYNEKVKDPEQKIPYLVVVIDELADLMMQQGPEVEQAICRLAQLARATGIHLVIATQRPSVDVITGLIKANVPSRISFAVSSQVDSRTVLDGKGAESLIGRGDMLFKPVDAPKPVRIQGAFLREAEVERVVQHLKAQGSPEYVAEPLSVDHGAYGQESVEESEDDLFEPAAKFVVTTGHASTSMIQRKFKIGYTRAARLVDMMEARGIVGALDGAKPREILKSRDAVDEMFRATRNSVYQGTDFAPVEEDDAEVEIEDTVASHDPFVGE